MSRDIRSRTIQLLRSSPEDQVMNQESGSIVAEATARTQGLGKRCAGFSQRIIGGKICSKRQFIGSLCTPKCPPWFDRQELRS